MEFTIIVQMGVRRFKMNVKQIYKSDQIEKYEVTGGQRSIVLRNNRPFLKNIRSRKKPDWKLDAGEFNNVQALALTIEAIENGIDRIENPSVPYKHPKNL